MWSFFQSAPKTRLENLVELKGIIDKIAEIRSKQSYFNSNAGADSLEYQKNSILVNILNFIDEKTNAFNQQETCATKADELRAAVQLLHTIERHLSQKIVSHYRVLSEHRHYIPSKGVLGTVVASFVGVGAASIVALPAVAAVAATAVGGYVAGGFAAQAVGIDSHPKPISLQLLEELAQMLKKAVANINADLIMNAPRPAAAAAANPLPVPVQAQAQEDKYEDFCCVILKTWMRDPVRCRLDNQHYERSAIIRILGHDKKSPINREPLPEGILPSEVVEIDEPFNSRMQAYRNAHPEKEEDIKADLGEALEEAPRP